MTENDSWNEQAVRDIGLPQNSIIAAIQRDGKMIIPNGSTVPKDGDILTMGAEPEKGSSCQDPGNQASQKSPLD